MARARNIKPSFFTNDDLAEHNCPLGRLLFIGLWCLADHKGELEWRANKIKVQLLPYDECDIRALAINLDKSGFVTFYSDGQKVYLKINNFEKHQNPHPNERKVKSEVPPFAPSMRQAVDLETLTINRESSRAVAEQQLSDPADSPFLIPDSLLPSGGAPSSPPPHGESLNGVITHADQPEEQEPEQKGKSPPRFVKPTLEELEDEFTGKVPNPRGEALKFLNHYESNGWKVGKSPMKSWPHAVSNWVIRRHEHANPQPSLGTPAGGATNPGAVSTVGANSAAAQRIRQEILDRTGCSPAGDADLVGTHG